MATVLIYCLMGPLRLVVWINENFDQDFSKELFSYLWAIGFLACLEFFRVLLLNSGILKTVVVDLIRNLIIRFTFSDR